MKSARFFLPLLAAVLLAGCGDHGAPPPAASLPPARVREMTVHTEEVPELIEITGTVRPVQRALIAAKVMGPIVALPVTLGQSVKAGDLLVRISAGEIAARVLQAQAQLDQARRDLDRERALLAKNASTPAMVKDLADRYAMTEAMVREAKVMLGYATVRAPFDGVIARKLVSVGDLASPGIPLLELEGRGDYQVEAGVPDSLMARLNVGAPLAVDVPTAGVRFTGHLAEVSSAADPMTHTVTVKISVPAGTRVGSGQFARVQIPGESVRALLAPAAAISRLGEMERVFLDQDHVAVLRLIKTGARRGDLVEVLGGLSAGDRVVINPPTGLREGQPLEIQP